VGDVSLKKKFGLRGTGRGRCCTSRGRIHGRKAGETFLGKQDWAKRQAGYYTTLTWQVAVAQHHVSATYKGGS